MAVIYDVIFNDNRRIIAHGGCFGAMNAGQWSNWMIDYDRFGQRSGVTGTENRHQASVYFNQLIDDYRNSASDVKPVAIQFYPQPSAGMWGSSAPHGSTLTPREAYFAAMAELVPQIAWLDGVVSLHPEFNVVRIHLGDRPADHIMTALFLMRNLAQYNFGHSYQRLINHYNMNAVPAVYLAHLVDYQPRTPFTRESWNVVRPGEYNLQHPGAFGRQALRNVLRADESFDPWRQLAFVTQLGYLRDLTLDQVFSRTGPRAHRARTLSMTLCIPEDEVILPDTQDADGYISVNSDSYNPFLLTEEHLQRCIDAYAEVCRSAGVEPFYR